LVAKKDWKVTWSAVKKEKFRNGARGWEKERFENHGFGGKKEPKTLPQTPGEGGTGGGRSKASKTRGGDTHEQKKKTRNKRN